MEDFDCRVRTFGSMPPSDHFDSEFMAEAGFYFTGNLIKCFSCLISETKECFEVLSRGTDLRSYHYTHCPFFREKRGQEFEWRLSTYDDWPLKGTLDPTELALAGFYYFRPPDRVICFSCLVVISYHCNPFHDPWEGHARLSPHCSYLQQNKDEEFIRRCWGNKKPEEELYVLLNSPLCLTARDMGVDQLEIETALRKQLQETGAPFKTPYDLINSTIDLKADSSSNNVPQEQLDVLTPQGSIHPDLACMNEPSSTSSSVPQEEHDIFKHVDVAILAALEVGLDTSLILKTLRKKLIETGTLFDTPEDFINCALGNLDEPSSTNSTERDEDNLSGRINSLMEEIEKLRMEKSCKICLDEDISILFLPCRHMVTCDACASQVSSCPICRKPIEARDRIYLS